MLKVCSGTTLTTDPSEPGRLYMALCLMGHEHPRTLSTNFRSEKISHRKSKLLHEVGGDQATSLNLQETSRGVHIIKHHYSFWNPKSLYH